MIRLTEYVHQRLAQVIPRGAYVFDLTAGNGHDTLFLAEWVGPTGYVWAFDIQSQAIEKTRTRLVEQGYRHVELFQADHSLLDRYVPVDRKGKISAVVMNLGFLPNSDRVIITRAETTQIALEKACEYLAPHGVLSVTAYRGHAGALEEHQVVQNWFESNQTELQIEQIISDEGHPQSPVLWWAEKRAGL